MKLVVITGTCGAGKSTIKDEIEKRLDSRKYACMDTDEVELTGGIMRELIMNIGIVMTV